MQVGYIYKLSAPETNKIYIGSTKYPNRRFGQHKASIASSKIVMQYPGVKMDILETMNYNNRNELLNRERHHILENISNCVNKQKPLRTKHEYYQDNKQKINDHSNMVEVCKDCNKTYTLRNKARHYKRYCKPEIKENDLLVLLFCYLFIKNLCNI
jgi:predicted GIY-YIG superfamily endonuclease